MAATRVMNLPRGVPPSTVIQYDLQAFGNSDVIKTSAAALLSAIVSNKGTATLYIMFFDSTTVPSNGATPIMQPLVVFGGSQQALDLTDTGTNERITGLSFSTGLAWAASTTQATLTVDATNSIWLSARYV